MGKRRKQYPCRAVRPIFVTVRTKGHLLMPAFFPRPTSRRPFSFCLALALLPTIPAAHAQNVNSYVVTDLTTGNGASIINVTGINNKGQVVGALQVGNGFVWTPTTPNATNGTLQDIGIGGGYKINDSGQVLGSANVHAYIWTKDGGVQYITGGGRYMAAATGINNAGQVIGPASRLDDDPPGGDNWLWQNGTFTHIANPTGYDIIANGLNNKGEVVGQLNLPYDTTTNSYPVHAFLWQNGVTQDLGTYPGFDTSDAFDVNDNTQVIGALGNNGTIGGNSFLWQNGTMTYIGNQAEDINNKGDIVGYSQQSETHALIWHKGQWYRLDAGVSAPNEDPFWFAECINDAGQIGVRGRYGYSLLTPNIVLNSVSVSPNPVATGSTATGKVTLRYPVFVDTKVTLSTTNPNATVPTSVTVPALKTSATFTITAKTGTGSGTLTAKTTGPSGTMTKTATLTVGPVDVDKLTLSPATVTGGVNVTGTLTLNAAAPSGGLSVSLITGKGSVAKPTAATLTVPAGAKTATFTVQTFPTSAPTNVTLSATAAGVTRTAMLTVNPGLAGLKTAHPTVQGGHHLTGTVTLSGPAASDLTTALVSSNPSVLSFPASVTVPAGGTTATFTLTAAKVTANVPVQVSAKLGLVKSVTVTVTP